MIATRSLRAAVAPHPRRAVLALAVAALGLAGLWLAAGTAGASATSSAGQLVLGPNNWLRSPQVTLPRGTTSAVGWASTNWSGYAVTGTTPASSITGQWTVPSVSRTSGASYSAAWAGIDGFANSSLIQTGTEQDYDRGGAHYSAWWTTSAQGFLEQTINEPVSPGDSISAKIMESTTTASLWTISLSDSSLVHAAWAFNTTVTYTGPGASAEWIIEAPTVGNQIAPLAVYSSPLTFDAWTVNGVNPNLLASEGGEMLARSWGRQYQVISIPSAPDGNKDAFNMAYGATAPLPPSP